MAKLYNLARMLTATTGTGTITLSTAKTGYLSFASAGISDGDVIAYAVTDGANSEIGYGVYTASGTTLTRNVRRSTNSNSAISLSGSAEVAITPAAEDLISMSPPQGRLTLTTGTPVMTSTTSAQTTVYYTPYKGRFTPKWTGSHFEMADFGGELSQATTDSTKSPAAATTNAVYDMLLWLDGSTWRVTRGAAWSSATSRGTGAGTAEIEWVQGYPVNKVAVTNGPAARYGLVVGTIYTNGSSQVDWGLGGNASGGTAASLHVWNMFNRVRVAARVRDTATSWTYASTTIRSANNSTGNRISLVRGLDEDAVDANYSVVADGGSGLYASCCIGLDSTSARASDANVGSIGNVASVEGSLSSVYSGTPGLGVHYLQALEFIAGAGTAVYYGGTTQQYMRFTALVMA